MTIKLALKHILAGTYPTVEEMFEDQSASQKAGIV